MEITRGVIKKAQKVICYGPEGIGKSTFASKFPNPVFTDTEGSTALLDVARLQKPSSWTMLLLQAKYIKDNPKVCDTYVIDTADWAEMLCVEQVCAKAQNTGIEDFGYGKGYIYLAEEFGKLLNLLQEVVDTGTNVVITAHAAMRKVERPEETGAYDHWELKLQKKTAPLLKEWADMVLFANYEIHVVNVDGQGATKGKNKAQGGKRVMYTCHTPYWDAKNRHGLEYKLDFDFAKIAHCIPSKDIAAHEAPAKILAEESKSKEKSLELPQSPSEPVKAEESKVEPVESKEAEVTNDKPLNALYELMNKWGVTAQDIQLVVSQRGYYPKETAIQKYDPNFIAGSLVAAWDKVHDMIIDNQTKDIPF